MSGRERRSRAVPSNIIVVEKRQDFRWHDPDGRVITMDDYVAMRTDGPGRARKVINLCRSYDYLGGGYYCSLLAEARGDRILPSVETILELQQKSLHADRMAELDRELGDLADLPAAISSFTLLVLFGRIDDPAFARLAQRSFELFRCPLLELEIERGDGARWRVASVSAGDLRDVEPERDDLFLGALEDFTRRTWRPAKPPRSPVMDLAVLYDPRDPMPPSRTETLRHLAKIGESMGVAVELIEKKDFARLTQFDALFIRETTAVPHHTYRFAKKAAAEGMPVIDDPASILRCTNKAFLADLLAGNGVATPRTLLATKRNLGTLEQEIEFPAVLKIPDGSFSRGVKRAKSLPEFRDIAGAMLKESEIILIQEYLETAFDWRVGALAGEALFVARYFMCGGHWQILKHGADGSHTEGRTEAVALADTPPEVLAAAIRAARLVGDGFYGVDLKQTRHGVFVIEVNDNPNLDMGSEDGILGDELYRTLLRRFLSLLEARRSTSGMQTGGTAALCA
jgi:glutathione synthase/RimK-type ligase-like ATP-grasp enzyme